MKKYSIISNKKRNELIERVVKNGQSVSRVSKQLRIKLPSAKSIIRTFKRLGKIFDKKKLISRKLNKKKGESSETDHQSDISLLNEERKEGKFIKEEQTKNGRLKQTQYREVIPAVQSSFKVCENMEGYVRQYIGQMYLNQEMNFYYNILTLYQNQGIFSTKY